ncbi:MAG TPA: ABC transporter permease [Gemmatimonadaceae bacterium]|nr:ABC transporter permease [Gemmatimonadaceae bacterium]
MTWNPFKRWARRSDDDFSDEVESHLAMEAERLVRGGMSEDDAHHAARRVFGNATVAREHFHESRRWSALESLAQDVRYGLRGLRRTPGFTAIAVASLAIGIGANTTMFGAIDALLVRTPAHVQDATRVHRVYFEQPTLGGGTEATATAGYKTYTSLRDGVRGFEAVGAFWAKTVSSGRGQDARPIDAVLATPSVFTLLGVQPALGRFFAASEERDDGDHVAVLGYDAWRAWFSGDSAVLGRTIDVAGLPYVIVGVAPEGFIGVNLSRVDLWLPLGAATRLLSPGVLDPGGGYWLQIIGKRRAGMPLQQLAAEVTSAYRDAWRTSRRYAETYAKSRAILGPVADARGPAPSADAKVSIWVAAVSFLVLLIACANVANLLLLRGLTRSRETALRLSLGASRWRIMRQWLVDSALLAAAGAAGALLLARWSATAMKTLLLPGTSSASLLDPRLLFFTAIVAVGTAALASVVPALAMARRDFQPLLGAGRVAGIRQRLALQRALITGQVALATLLLVGAGLFVTSLRNVRAIDLGLDVDHLLYVSADVGSRGQKASDSSANATYQEMLESARRVPGVTHATLTAGEPLASGWAISLARRGVTLQPGDRVPFARAVGTDYFETMGTALRRGRLFTAADHAPNAHVAIVDEATAKHFWPTDDPLDPCVHLGDDNSCTQIVGVVANTVLWEVTGEKGLVVYVPIEAHPSQTVTMLEVRTSGDPTTSIATVRQAVSSVSPDLPWVDIQPVSDRLSPQLKPWRLGASMFTAFGVLALCLAAVGLYGLLSYMVAQRTHEIGVRKALGASDGGVIRMVLFGSLGMTLAGVAGGVLIALGAGRLVANQLYGVSPRDPAVMALCVGVLVVVAIVACIAPARRATRVDPMVALRAD